MTIQLNVRALALSLGLVVATVGVAQAQNVVEVLSDRPEFSTLVTAVTEAGLVDTLNSEGPFTIFAPTNDAFAAIPADQLDAVLADQDLLTSILTYHVVAGKVMAEDVVNLKTAKTVEGSNIKIKVSEEGTVHIDNAKVVAADVKAKNGVIHVIDSVILPDSDS